jgi:hypothetical protein
MKGMAPRIAMKAVRHIAAMVMSVIARLKRNGLVKIAVKNFLIVSLSPYIVLLLM